MREAGSDLRTPGAPGASAAQETRVPEWPARLREVSHELRSAPAGAARDRALEETWLLLESAISRYARFHSSRLGSVPREDLEDLSSQKSLDLLRRLEVGEWDMAGRTPSEITGFLSKVARNGLLDLLRERRRRVEPKESDPEQPHAPSPEPMDRADGIVGENAPDSRVSRREFVDALRQCVARLPLRSQWIWFLRVLGGLPSREIAAHPEVSVNRAHVDVLLQRCRKAVRKCMRSRGHEPHEMPPGTFVELWQTVRIVPARSGGES
jgi:RNA polymerase sigma factor (sigma-70 family)